MVLSWMIYLFFLAKACSPFRWKNSVDHSVLNSDLVQSPMNWLPNVVHASSTIKSGAPWIDCLALFMHPPLSSTEPPVRGKYGFCYFPNRFLHQTCVYVYIMLFFVCLFCFVLCRERRRRDGSPLFQIVLGWNYCDWDQLNPHDGQGMAFGSHHRLIAEKG